MNPSPHARIAGIAYHLPETRLGNDDLAALHPEFSAKKVRKAIGVEERRVVVANEYASDLAYQAALALFAEQPEARANVDFLLYCTQSPDHFLPATACILQHRLGLQTSIGALDFNLGCSGYVYGLGVAKGLICSGMASSVLLLTSDTATRNIGGSEKIALQSLFGDAASATLVLASNVPAIHEFVVGTDGSGADNLIIRKGAYRDPSASFGQGDPDDDERFLHMNGPEIFNFTIEAVPKAVQSCLDKNSLAMHDIDHVIFHQANGFMLEYLRSKIGIPTEKFHNDLRCTGNTSSSSIPIGICQRRQAGVATIGQRLLLVGFGVGYSWGAIVVTL